jgi:RNA methyltransferase, TrmH family
VNGRRRSGSSRAPKRKERIDLDDVIYGVHAVEEALSAAEPLRRLYVGDERKRDPALRRLLDDARALGVPVRYESRTFFSQFPYRAHQSVVAYGVPYDYVTLEEALAGSPRLVGVLVEAADPGNVGTEIRVADAAGADAVVLAGDVVDPYNGKCVRGSAGSVFHLPLARVRDVTAVLASCRRVGLWLLAATASGELDLDDADTILAEPSAWLFGNETHGLPAEVAAVADHRIAIPIHGRAESLNLATAAAVCVYATARAQRRCPGPTVTLG